MNSGFSPAGDWTMDDREKTKTQLIKELEVLRRSIGVLDATEDEREKAAEASLAYEEPFRSVFEHAAIGMVVTGLDGRFRHVNRAMCDIVGYSEAALLRKTFLEITHPDDLDTDLRNVRRMLAGEISLFQMEKRYIHQDGHLVWVFLNGTMVRDHGGAPLFFIAQIQDIAERKRSEEALRESEERFRRLSDASFEGIVITEKGVVLDGHHPCCPLKWVLGGWDNSWCSITTGTITGG